MKTGQKIKSGKGWMDTQNAWMSKHGKVGNAKSGKGWMDTQNAWVNMSRRCKIGQGMDGHPKCLSKHGKVGLSEAEGDGGMGWVGIFVNGKC
jgi:hypothetical protein